jgi:transposase
MFFIGIDVHKKQSQICVLDEHGTVLFETRVPTSRADLSDVLGPYRPARILLESSTPSEWVARHMESLGADVIVADPGFAPMYATRCKKVKTDKRDARALAQACRLGAYKPAHRLSDAQRQVRTLFQMRKTLVQARTMLINQIGSVLLGQGYTVPTGSSEQYEKRLARLELPEGLRVLLSPLVALLQPLCQQIAALDDRLAALAQSDEAAVRLQAVPGVGPLTAVMFIAGLDGAERFENAHQVMSYLGLVPREMSSGEKQIRGSITKAGNTQLRVLLVQAALTMMRVHKPQTEALVSWAEAIAQRRGKGIARVALARRLVGILWAMLRDGSVYKPAVRMQGPAKRAVRKRPVETSISP